MARIIGEWTEAKLASFVRTIIASEPLASQSFDELTIGKLRVTGDFEGLGASVPVGAVLDYGGTTNPPGWLICDGSVYNQGDYAELYNVVGSAFNIGGESAGTFRVPNLKGRVVVGHDSATAQFDTVGETGGSTTNSHIHTYSTSTSVGGSHRHTIPGEGVQAGGGAVVADGPTDFDGSHSHTVSGSTGAPNDTNIMQPYIIMRKIIRATAI